MRYAILLKPHANVRYRQSLQKLAQKELACALAACGLDAPVTPREVAGESFLTFDTDRMTDECWRDVSGLSCACLAGELEGERLTILGRERRAYLPDELPELLKYKGKTNADFTAMMLRCARDASAFWNAREPLTVLDPLCGKATTLFCALCAGDNAVGVDRDEKALREADAFLGRCLELHRLKHRRETASKTLKAGGAARVVRYVVADTAEHWKRDDTRTLELICADARDLPQLVKPESCHLVATDLPYGVQHAPREGGRVSSLQALAQAIAPGCRAALKPGGAAAFAFNAYTLRREDMARAARDGGLRPLTQPPYDDFSHWVEQAVERDLLLALRD